MATKNLGLVKSIFKQSTSPVRIDVLWYDTLNEILKYYDISALAWLPVMSTQLLGSLTDGTPTAAEIDAVTGLTPAEAGAGYQITIKDSDGTGLLYRVESDGTDWFYIVTTKAL